MARENIAQSPILGILGNKKRTPRNVDVLFYSNSLSGITY